MIRGLMVVLRISPSMCAEWIVFNGKSLIVNFSNNFWKKEQLEYRQCTIVVALQKAIELFYDWKSPTGLFDIDGGALSCENALKECLDDHLWVNWSRQLPTLYSTPAWADSTGLKTLLWFGQAHLYSMWYHRFFLCIWNFFRQA